MVRKTFQIRHLKEPALVFGGNNIFEDPKIGLAAFGPYYSPDIERPTPSEIRLGIVGTGKTIDLAKQFLERLRNPIPHQESGKLQYPTFPGFSSQSPFRCEFVISNEWEQKITRDEIAAVRDARGTPKRIIKAARLYATKIRVLLDQEPKPDVILCATPNEFDPDQLRQINPELSLAELEEYEAEQSVLLEPLPEVFPELEYAHRLNFRAVLKAEAMKLGVPTQIIREATLRNAPGTQDPSLVAWNLCIAVYYKGGGTPWRLSTLTPDTCYIGIAFYRERRRNSERMRTAMAHIFAGQAESLVLRGDPVTIDTERNRTPHLGRDAFAKLLQQSLALYREHTRHFPRRVVVHKTSEFNEAEILGSQDVLNQVGEYDLVAFGKRYLRFFRIGEHPPLRGTMISLPGGGALLYTVGYVPLFKLYMGHRIPKPLDIIQHIGDSTMETICREILALTKMDWNNTDFSQTHPITVGFPRKVGQVLAVTPRDEQIQTSYRYYM